jgi:hypothetical protein
LLGQSGRALFARGGAGAGKRIAADEGDDTDAEDADGDSAWKRGFLDGLDFLEGESWPLAAALAAAHSCFFSLSAMATTPSAFHRYWSFSMVWAAPVMMSKAVDLLSPVRAATIVKRVG